MEEKIQDLEAQIKQLRRAMSALALLFLFFILLVLFRNDELPTELQVTSLDVVNESGQVVVHTGVRNSGAGGFWVADEEGTPLLKLNQNEQGGVITILASEGSKTQIIGIEESKEGFENGSQ